MSYSHRGMERLGGLLEDIAKKLVKPKEDLPLANSTLERAVQRAESIARRLFLLPQLPSSVAAVITSIGTGGRDFSTIASWEADLDNSGIYSADDDAVGECYNDSAFDEAFTINGGGTVGLNSVTLSVASGERHDGTAGSGARIDRSTANGTVVTLAVPATIEWLEIDRNSNPDSGTSQGILVDIDGCTVRNMILHGIRSTDGLCFGIVDSNEDFDAMNNIIYNLLNEATGSAKCGGITDGGGTARTYRWLNNTVYNVVNNGGSGACYGFDFVGGTLDVRNNIAIGTTGTTTGAKADFLGTSGASIDYNCDSDGSATGANSITSSAANLFVSVVAGSEDLQLKAGADAIDAGTNLGTTPSGVEIDINGRDRDANGDTWDMGAHEYVAAGGGTSSGVASLVLAAAIAAGSATFSSTSHTGSASLSSPAAIADASATSTAPTFSASAALNSPAAIESAAATFTPPVFTAAASLGTSSAITTGSAAFAAAIFSASAALETASSTVVASAATTTPTFDASATLITPASIGVGAAMFAAEIYTGSAALDTPASVASGTASFSSASTGTANLVASSAIATATATFTEPTYQATASLVVAAPVVTATDISGNPIPFYYQFLLAAGTN